MPVAIFIAPNANRYETEAAIGYSLMEAARAAGVPGIRADCGGACACATCHVHVAPEWRERVGAPTAVEREMLDFADNVTAASRLSCQIIMRADLAGVTLDVVAA